MQLTLSVIFVVFTFGSLKAFGTTSTEVQHLLAFIEAANCQYERNGTMHSAQDAKAHIYKKYNYYQDDINSAEDFIRLAATKSSLSGKHYQIHCPNKPVTKSSEWLLAELAKYREE
ncbi:DUF5329 domain-containing protein [Pseudoalteromonas luteoviolacea]|uniref:DUF5329 family protein n=1 Tax=Pseudoalteromonas luteoviolacea TaxID=43657 RepID=UPI001B376D7C|nr:DUF5329 domain-containing protein [Pseudoalteromonas luteoviolacea]MBQ4834751.1 DUF5329 family protein [Pseudoalteromonas luteoviolacea]